MDSERGTEYTPGPWRLDDYRGDSEGRSSDDICTGSYEDHNHISIATIWNCGGRGFPSDDEFVANTRLIAAAPETAAERDRLRGINADLLAALKMADAYFDAREQNSREVPNMVVRDIRAAIAKAEVTK